MITHEVGYEEARTCLGDEPSEDGFYPCDEKGNEAEPVAEWSGLYVCAPMRQDYRPLTRFVLWEGTRNGSSSR